MWIICDRIKQDYISMHQMWIIKWSNMFSKCLFYNGKARTLVEDWCAETVKNIHQMCDTVETTFQG